MTADSPMSDGYWLKVQDEAVAELLKVMQHAREALENELPGEAWAALNETLKAHDCPA